MSAHSFNQDHFDALDLGFSEVADPGDAGTIEIEGVGRAICKIVTAGAESRILEDADSLPLGTELLCVLTTAGDVTLDTDDTDVVLADAGDVCLFVVSYDGTNKVWRALSFDLTALEARVDTAETDIAAAEADILGLKQGLRSGTSTAMADTAAVTEAAVLGGFILGTPVGAATYTLPTPAELVAAVAAYETLAVGQLIRFSVHNAGADADAITMAAGAGATDEGTLTIAQDVTRDFVVVLTNVTAASEAYILYGIG